MKGYFIILTRKVNLHGINPVFYSNMRESLRHNFSNRKTPYFKFLKQWQ